MFEGFPVSVSNVISVPVSASMYQTMVANIQQIHAGSDGTVCVTPVVQVSPHSSRQPTLLYSDGNIIIDVSGKPKMVKMELDTDNSILS